MVKSGCALEIVFTLAVVVKSSEIHSTSPIVGSGLLNVCIVSNTDMISTGSAEECDVVVVAFALEFFLLSMVVSVFFAVFARFCC